MESKATFAQTFTPSLPPSGTVAHGFVHGAAWPAGQGVLSLSIGQASATVEPPAPVEASAMGAPPAPLDPAVLFDPPEPLDPPLPELVPAVPLLSPLL